MLFIYIHLGFAGLIFLILLYLLCKMYRKRQITNTSAITPSSNILKTVPTSRTHHSTHRSSKHSAQSDDHHIITLQNTQRLHRTLQKKGTFTIESVPETNSQARNSMKSNNAVSPARNILKTPTLIRKNSGYQIMKTNNRIETQQFHHNNIPNNLPTIPSLQELPDSVRQSEIQFLGEIKQNQDNRQNYINTVYRVLIRCVISQGLIGCFLLLELHSALCVLIDLVVVWIFRFLQSDRKLVQVLQLFISFGFDTTILFLFQIDLTWTISFIVLIFIDSILEIIIIKTQRSHSQETMQTQH